MYSRCNENCQVVKCGNKDHFLKMCKCIDIEDNCKISGTQVKRFLIVLMVIAINI